MRDLERALEEIGAIKDQLARGARFRGFGPTTFAATSVLGSAAAVVQTLIPPASNDAYLALWVAVAAASCGIISVEMIGRSRRLHTHLADEMLRAAVEQFLPAGLVGALLTLIVWRLAPQSLWMLPGLWQVVFGLGVFASARFLPSPMWQVGAWYLTTGLGCLALFHGPAAFAPWVMGVPFGVGQLMVAAILHLDQRSHD